MGKLSTFLMLLNQRANSTFRNPLHYPVAIYPLELTKGSQVAKQQARKLGIVSDNPARGCFKIQADHQPTRNQGFASVKDMTEVESQKN